MLLKNLKRSLGFSYRNLIKKSQQTIFIEKEQTEIEKLRNRDEKEHMKKIFAEMLNKKFESIKLDS